MGLLLIEWVGNMDTPEGYESIMHVIAEKLMVHFEGSGAINYIEQIFEDKEDKSKSFTLTMQMTEGLTPCQELQATEERIKELEKQRAVWHESFNVELKDNNDLRVRVKELEARIHRMQTRNRVRRHNELSKTNQAG